MGRRFVMLGRTAASALLSIALVVTVMVVGRGQTQVVHADSWGSWLCQWSVYGYPIPGGSLSARGCARTWDCGGCPTHLWQTWSDTQVSYVVYETYTYVASLDSCNGGAGWSFWGSTSNYSYNTSDGTSGNPLQTGYSDCPPGGDHRYRVDTSNYELPSSVSTQWYGSGGTVYF